jgi:hypothetical protein
MRTLDRIFLIAGLISLSFLIGVSSCDYDAGNDDDRPTQRMVEASLQESQWKISYFFDTGNATNHFTGYVFQFHLMAR